MFGWLGWVNDAFPATNDSMTKNLEFEKILKKITPCFKIFGYEPYETNLVIKFRNTLYIGEAFTLLNRHKSNA